jgi:hypothetical protein
VDNIPTVPPPVIIDETKYHWTGKGDFKPEWNDYVIGALTDATSLMKGADDIVSYCPKWDSIAEDQREGVIVQLIAAITEFESGFKLTSRMVEPQASFPKPDPVTKKPVASEGLLQLSYQDELSYKGKIPAGYCDFDWSKDKSLGDKDPKKTIFDAKTNLQCGLVILERQVKLQGKIGYDKSYWAVLRPNGKYSKTKKIQEIVKGFERCK